MPLEIQVLWTLLLSLSWKHLIKRSSGQLVSQLVRLQNSWVYSATPLCPWLMVFMWSLAL